jgi:hypothetical protein
MPFPDFLSRNNGGTERYEDKPHVKARIGCTEDRMTAWMVNDQGGKDTTVHSEL